MIGVYVVVVSSRKTQFNPWSFAIELPPVPRSTCGGLVISHPRAPGVCCPRVQHHSVTTCRTRAGGEFYGTLLGLYESSLQTPLGVPLFGNAFSYLVSIMIPTPLRPIPKHPTYWVGGWLGGRIYLLALWTMLGRFFQVFSVVRCLA